MKRKYFRNIIFSKTPLTGHFRFEDEFQIYPCDYENAPTSKHANDIPLIIEFWIDEDENPEVPEDLQSIKSLISKLFLDKSPMFGFKTPAIIFIAVDFPIPFWPRIPTTFPNIGIGRL